jgi:uncharacterized protein
MESKKFGDKIIFRIDRGEELVESLLKICMEYDIKLGSVSGIGATDKVKVGLFDVESKEYHSKEFTGAYEIAPMSGNISTMDGELYLHLHINICDDKHNSYGGHLNSAVISATFEGVIDIINGEIDRKKSEEVGLNLIKF